MDIQFNSSHVLLKTHFNDLFLKAHFNDLSLQALADVTNNIDMSMCSGRRVVWGDILYYLVYFCFRCTLLYTRDFSGDSMCLLYTLRQEFLFSFLWTQYGTHVGIFSC